MASRFHDSAGLSSVIRRDYGSPNSCSVPLILSLLRPAASGVQQQPQGRASGKRATRLQLTFSTQQTRNIRLLNLLLITLHCLAFDCPVSSGLSSLCPLFSLRISSFFRSRLLLSQLLAYIFPKYSLFCFPAPAFSVLALRLKHTLKALVKSNNKKITD